MNAVEYNLKKQQIARLKDQLKRRFFNKAAIDLARAIIDCENYEKEQRNKNADEFRTNN